MKTIFEKIFHGILYGIGFGLIVGGIYYYLTLELTEDAMNLYSTDPDIWGQSKNYSMISIFTQ